MFENIKKHSRNKTVFDYIGDENGDLFAEEVTRLESDFSKKTISEAEPPKDDRIIMCDSLLESNIDEKTVLGLCIFGLKSLIDGFVSSRVKNDLEK